MRNTNKLQWRLNKTKLKHVRIKPSGIYTGTYDLLRPGFFNSKNPVIQRPRSAVTEDNNNEPENVPGGHKRETYLKMSRRAWPINYKVY